MVRCNVYVLSWCAFPHPLASGKGWDEFFCSQHAVLCSTFSCKYLTLLHHCCSHAWDVSCTLDYAVVPFMLRASSWLCALQNIWFCLRKLLSLNSCLCDGSSWGKCSCILYCHRGPSRMGKKQPSYHCTLSIVQLCHFSTRHLLTDTFSCMRILLSELCCVLLHWYAASHEYVKIQI